MRTSRRSFLLAGAVALTGVGGCASTERVQAQRATPPPLPSPTPTEKFLVYRDLAYAENVGRAHLLDVYLPLDRTGPAPVVIFQAGSAFKSDDTKGDAIATATAAPTAAAQTVTQPEPFDPAALAGMVAGPQVADWLVPRGYAVVGLNVRSSGQAKFPAQVHDIKAAIRYLRANAGHLGLDPERFATMGNSSGGWVATMAAVTSGIADLQGELGHPDQSSAVSAVIDLYGPTDFLQMNAHKLPGAIDYSGADSPESMLMGFPIETDPVAVQKANPATYVSADSPPALIVHGMADPFVPYNQSEILFDAYRRAGATATLALIPGVKHTDAYLADADLSAGRTVSVTRGGTVTTGTEPAATFDAVVAFLDTHLGR